ncbi:hypothetical protein LN736_15160 [Clostridium sp. WLY-B-L2]|uniref:Uncharacterized protein n=1 Tax=Clostridium aromativorans TaxID=2836848 RepID=A0ABS8N8Q8_9CLOT|nr:hypothetical protein [Clostridium aromativorans]MCC9296197.1 hypothetical protein [Clostridium aromativorans]
MKKMGTESIDVLSDKYTEIVIETDEENPTTITEITNEDANVANGYRIRLTPNYDRD